MTRRRAASLLAGSLLALATALIAVSGSALAFVPTGMTNLNTVVNNIPSTATPYTYPGPFSDLKGGSITLTFEQNAVMYCTSNSSVTNLTGKLDYTNANLPAGASIVVHLWPNGGSNANPAAVEANYVIITFPSGLTGSGTINISITITSPFTATTGGILIVSDVTTSKTNSLNCSEAASPTDGVTASPTAVITASPTAVITASPTAVITASPTAVITASPTAVITASPTAVITASPTAVITASPTAVITASPTAVITATPFESVGGQTSTPVVTATPFESVGGETGTPVVTTPPTSTDGNSGNSSTPLVALLICLAFGAMGLVVVEMQRRSANR